MSTYSALKKQVGLALSMNDFWQTFVYTLTTCVYTLCTGNVKFVTVDIAKHPYRTQDKKTVFPAMKKFLQAYIPQGRCM